MIVSFADLVDQVARFTQKSDNTFVLQYIRNEINAEYHRIAQEEDWEELLTEITESLSLVAGEAYLALPGDVSTIKSMINDPQDFVMHPKPLTQQHHDHPSTHDVQGRAIYYTYMGHKATKRPLSTDDTLSIVPEAALMSEAEVRISGIRGTKLITERDAIVTSTTSTVAGAVTYRSGWSIDSIGTNTETDQYIEIQETTAGTTIGYIPKGKKNSLFFMLKFENPPDASNAVSVVYKRQVQPLIDDDDVIMIPDAGHAIVQAVIARVRQFERRYQEAGVHRAESNNYVAGVRNERDTDGNRGYQMRVETPWRPSR